MAETTRDGAALAEVRELLDSYFRHTLRLDLDEDIPACAADLVALTARWVAEALSGAADHLRQRADEVRDAAQDSLDRARMVGMNDASLILLALAAEYRAGTR